MINEKFIEPVTLGFSVRRWKLINRQKMDRHVYAAYTV